MSNLEKFNCSYSDLVNIDKIVENPKNTNMHPDKQVEMLSKIIEYQGQRSPIVISKNSGFIVKGHCRLLALKKLGWKRAAVDYQSYKSNEQEYADLIADNKISELAMFDDEMLFNEIKGSEALQDLDFELLGLDNFSLEDVSFTAKNSSGELDLDDFDNFDHQCPKCGFEYDDKD